MPTVPTAAAPSALKERVETLLSERLDPRTAATVVRIASRMWLRTEPEALREEHVLGLTHGLAPLLGKLLGAAAATATLERILRESPR